MNAGNDANDKFHDQERKRLKLSWDDYGRKLAAERVGDEDQQVRDVLSWLRRGSYDDQIRADTIEKLINAGRPA